MVGKCKDKGADSIMQISGLGSRALTRLVSEQSAGALMGALVYVPFWVLGKSIAGARLISLP